MHLRNPDHFDQHNILGGHFASPLAELLGGDVQSFCLSSRHRRHIWCALLDIAPAGAKSALVRFGWEAAPAKLLEWAVETPSALLNPALRRLSPGPLKLGQYRALNEALIARPRSGRALCHMGHVSERDIDVVLALPNSLVEPSVIRLLEGDLERAKAVAELFLIAIEQGRDPANLSAAICASPDRIKLECLLTKAVMADRLPAAPSPNHPDVIPIRTAKELACWGGRFENCMASRARGGFGLRARDRAFFIWKGEPMAMIAVAPDHAGGYRIAEVRLRHNRRPPEAIMARISEAFREVGVRLRPEVNDLLMTL